MEEYWRGYHIPAFGSWDFYDQVPITQFFEAASNQQPTGVVRGHFLAEHVDLFKIPETVVTPSAFDYQQYYHYHTPKARKEGCKRTNSKELDQKKQGRVCDVVGEAAPKRHRLPKAVDDDLYKIPPELLYRKSNKRRRWLLSGFVSACLGLNCLP